MCARHEADQADMRQLKSELAKARGTADSMHARHEAELLEAEAAHQRDRDSHAQQMSTLENNSQADQADMQQLRSELAKARETANANATLPPPSAPPSPPGASPMLGTPPPSPPPERYTHPADHSNRPAAHMPHSNPPAEPMPQPSLPEPTPLSNKRYDSHNQPYDNHSPSPSQHSNQPMYSGFDALEANNFAQLWSGLPGSAKARDHLKEQL